MRWAEWAATCVVSGANSLLEFVAARCAQPPVFSRSWDDVLGTNEDVFGGMPFAGEVSESGFDIADAGLVFSARAEGASVSDVSSARVLVVLVVVLAGPVVAFT